MDLRGFFILYIMNENISFIFEYKQKALYQVTDLINNVVYFRIYLNDFYQTKYNYRSYKEAYKNLIK